MAIFDAYLKKLAHYGEELRGQGRQVREFICPTDVDGLVAGLPLRVGPEAGSGIILRGDSFIELGGPDAGSSSLLLWTDEPSLVHDGKVTLIGPDIPEAPGASLSFGQVLMVGGAGLSEKEHDALRHAQYISDQIEGYMLKSMPQRTWGRVSKEAAEKGFNFETLGRALMAIIKSSVAQVEAVEVIFVTSGREDLVVLESIEAQVSEISQNITKENWKAKGYDIECAFGWDCTSCEYSPVCDEIREVINVRKKKRAGGNGGSDS